MRPIKQNILARPCPSDSVSDGGIIVPDSFGVVSNKMEVVAVGEGDKAKPMQFKPGDIIFRVKDSGGEGAVYIDGVLHFLLPQSYILAKLN